MFKNKRGFTLIELLVVISIIGTLSTIALTSYTSVRIKTKMANVKVDMNNFADVVLIAEGEQNKVLMDITGSGCSRCTGSCTGRDLRNIPVTDSCYIAWMNVLNKLEAAANNYITGLDVLSRDPWGSPYILDENEGERPLNPCVRDHIRTVGPDGIYGTSDDLTFYLPFFNCS